MKTTLSESFQPILATTITSEFKLQLYFLLLMCKVNGGKKEAVARVCSV